MWQDTGATSQPVPAPGHSTWGGLYDSRGGSGGGILLYKTRRQILIEWIIIVAFLTHHIYQTYKHHCVLGLGDISHAICMRISSVKPVPWLAVNLHHPFSNGAAFNTQSRRSLTSYAISCSELQMNRLRFWTRYCVACQWSTALCIKCRSIWKRVMEINC